MFMGTGGNVSILADDDSVFMVDDDLGPVKPKFLADNAKARGIEAIGSVSSREKADYPLALGLDHAVYYKIEPVAERVLKITQSRGVDAPRGHVIGPVFLECLAMLADFGTAEA